MMRRALICFVSVQGLGRTGYHDLVGDLRLVWAVLDDFQLGPGEHGRLVRMLAG